MSTNLIVLFNELSRNFKLSIISALAQNLGNADVFNKHLWKDASIEDYDHYKFETNYIKNCKGLDSYAEMLYKHAF